jgi:hypothetical protein
MSHHTDKPILYADIVGYTKLLRDDRKDALQKLAWFKAQMRGLDFLEKHQLFRIVHGRFLLPSILSVFLS